MATESLTAPESVSPFRSLDSLRTRHAELLRQIPEAEAGKHLDEILEFLRRGASTGVLLDLPEDRECAQGLLDYWKATLYTQKRRAQDQQPQEPVRLPPIILTDFNPEVIGKIIEGCEQLMRSFSTDDQTLTRRILLRLLRLRDDNETWEVRPCTLEWVCERLDPREVDDAPAQEKAKRILAQLVELGVVRTIRSPSSLEDYALRSTELMNRWKRLQEWMAERRRFRQEATKWAQRRVDKEHTKQMGQPMLKRAEAAFNSWIQQFGAWILWLWRAGRPWIPAVHPSEDSLSAHDYEEAETYRDRSKEELKLIYEKLEVAKKRLERNQRLTGVAVAAALFCFVLATAALVFAIAANKNAKRADKNAEDAIENLKFAKNETARAKRETERANTEAKQNQILQRAEFRSTEAIRLANLAKHSSPQKSILLATEALRIIDNEIAKVGAGNASAFLLELRANMGESLRTALEKVGGLGYYADIGAIEHLAAYEDKTNLDKNAVRSLAAAGAKGLISLWRFADSKLLDQRILPNGYAPPIRELFFARDGAYLVSLNYRNNLTIWDLQSEDLTYRVLETAPDTPATIPPNPVITGIPSHSLYRSSSGNWLEIDDGGANGQLIHLGDPKKGPQQFDLNLQELKGATTAPLSFKSLHSFSRNELWFARITDGGDVVVWNLKAGLDRNRMSPAILPKRPGAVIPPNVRAVNGELLDDGSRLVVYFSDGMARYWDLAGETWGTSQDVSLRLAAGFERVSKLLTNERGTHAIVIAEAGSTKPGTNRLDAAFCFDGKDLQPDPSLVKKRLLQGNEARRITGYPEFDPTGRWLIGRGTSSNSDCILIWDFKTKDGENGTAPRVAKEIHFPEGISSVKSIPLSPCIVGQGFGNTVYWMNLLQPQMPLPLRSHDVRVTALAYSQQGRWLVTGGADGTVRAWNLNPLSASTEPFVFQSPNPESVLVTRDKGWAVLSLPDGALRFGRLDAGALVRSWIRHAADRPRGAASLTSSQDGHWLVEHRPETGLATLWKLSEKDPLRLGELDIGAAKIGNVLVNNSGTWLACQAGDAALLWDLQALKKGSNVPERSPGETLVCIAAADRLITRNEKVITQRDLLNKKPKREIRPKAEGKIVDAMGPPGGTRFVVWEEGNGKIRATLHDLEVDLDSDTSRAPELSRLNTNAEAFFSKAGDYLCSESSQQKGESTALNFPRYWHIGARVGTENVSDHDFRADSAAKEGTVLTRSHDGRWLVTKEHGHALLWDLNQRVMESNVLKSGVKLGNAGSSRFTQDSSWLIAAEAEQIRVYDLRKGVLDLRWEFTDKRVRGEILGAALMSRGAINMLALVVKFENDISMRVWDLKQAGGPKASILSTAGAAAPTDMMFSEDGKLILSFFADRMQVSRVELGEIEGKARDAVGRNLSEAEWKAIGATAAEIILPLAGDDQWLPVGRGAYRKTFEELPKPSEIDQRPVLGNKLRGKSTLLREEADTLINSAVKFGPQNKAAMEYAIELVAGRTYVFEMRSSEVDLYLVLKNPMGMEVGRDDDGGGYPDALLRYQCKVSGKHTIIATTFNGRNGKYRLSISEPRPKGRATGIKLGGDALEITGQVSEEDDETGDGPGVNYAVEAGKQGMMQLDLTSPTFDGLLRLEDWNTGATVAEGISVGGRTRIVVNVPAAAIHRIVVIGRWGKAGPFDLKVLLR